MRAGEAETSASTTVVICTRSADHAESGVIGLPSRATAEKGRALLDAFSDLFKAHLAQLVEQP